MNPARLPAPRVPRAIPAPRPARPTHETSPGERPSLRERFEVHPFVWLFAALAVGYCLGLARANWLIESVLRNS